MWYIVHLSMLIWDWNQLIVSDVINIRNISFNSVLITCPFFGRFGWFMVFNATFNNISVISWPKMEYPWNHRLAGHRCFLPRFGSFGRMVSEEKNLICSIVFYFLLIFFTNFQVWEAATAMFDGSLGHHSWSERELYMHCSFIVW